MNENSRRGIGSLAVTVGTKLLGWKGILLIVGILILILFSSFQLSFFCSGIRTSTATRASTRGN